MLFHRYVHPIKLAGEVNLAGLCDVVNLAEAYGVGSLVYVAWLT